MDYNVIDLWIHVPIALAGSVLMVECPKCGSKVLYLDKVPNRCYGCGQENYKEGDIAL